MATRPVPRALGRNGEPGVTGSNSARSRCGERRVKSVSAGGTESGFASSASGRETVASSVNEDWPARAWKFFTVARVVENSMSPETSSTGFGSSGLRSPTPASRARPSSAIAPGSFARPRPLRSRTARPDSAEPLGASAGETAARSTSPCTAKATSGSRKRATASVAVTGWPETRARRSPIRSESGARRAVKESPSTPTGASG